MNNITRLTLCLTILIGLLLSQKSFAWFGFGGKPSNEEASQKLYLVVANPEYYADPAMVAGEAISEGADVNYVVNGSSLLQIATQKNDQLMRTILINNGAAQ
jgi:hypothetical protein